MDAGTRALPRRVVAAFAGLLLVIGAMATVGAASASADSAPADPTAATTPTTVSADALPTVQINGVAWSQVVVGNTVYVAGAFTTARPAGAAAGTQETPRANLLAYDIRTGALLPFSHTLNAQARVVTASPDGTRVYVGGEFTTVDGQTRNRVAAFDTATGALVSTFKPSVSSTVFAIAATDSTVYLGGRFLTLGGVSRNHLAAVSASAGALLPAWAPTPGASPTAAASDITDVLSLVVPAGSSTVIAAGRFYSLNGVRSTGIGALDATTGATKPFAIGQVLTNAGKDAAIYAVSTDGTNVYGSAYNYNAGAGNLEGSFAVTLSGTTVWVNDCHGDNYSSAPINGVLYISSHTYDCSDVGGFSIQSSSPYKFANAVTLAASPSTRVGSGAFAGSPAPTMVDWFPTLSSGTYTGQYQAGWTVTGNSQYVVYGGEFPKVNGVGQQGLVRFAVPSIAPNKVAPVASADVTPTATALTSGQIRLNWVSTWDQDNENLTYSVSRSDDYRVSLYTVTSASRFWTKPRLSFLDKTAVPGTSYTYRITVTDPFGNAFTSASSSSVTASNALTGAYTAAVLADAPIDYWQLDEGTGSTSIDQTGSSDLTLRAGLTLGASGALTGSADTAATLDGSSAAYAVTPGTGIPPTTVSEEAWFQTSGAGGTIMGFSDNANGYSQAHDRQVFLTATGKATFAVWDGDARRITSTASYNDGQWHHVVATLSSGTMSLYVDGALVATRSDIGTPSGYNGVFKVGSDSNWDGTNTFTGSIDEVAVYSTALTAQQVAAHWTAGKTGRAPNTLPTASFTAATTPLRVSVDASASTDSDGTIASYAWTFGDGATATGVTATHTYATPGTVTVSLTVTDDAGGTRTSSQQVTVPSNTAPTAASTSSVADLTASFDGSGSADTDGSVASYAWTFGDGSSGTGRTTAHTYATGGTYEVTLTVTDDRGATGSVTSSVTVVAPNRAPTAAVTATMTDRSAAVDGSASTDPDGTVVSWAWAFGDGTTGTGATTSHTYAAAGDYTITLTVTDDRGGSGTLSTQVTAVDPPPANVAPTAAATPVATGLTVAADGSASADSDGTIVTYAWDFGDGTTATGATTSHTYAAAGTYSIQLTVTDDDGATGSTTTSVTVAVPNRAPTAVFTPTTRSLTVSVDASASTDPDGSIATYAWDFGDGLSGSGATATHTYATAGSYTVTLTVTDDRGAAATTSASVIAALPAVLASDAFARAVTGGLGTADVGGVWTSAYGPTRQSVNGGTATLNLPAATNQTGSYLGVSATSADLLTTVSVTGEQTGGGTSFYLTGRRVAVNQEYRARLRFLANGQVAVAITRLTGTTTETLVGAEVTLPASSLVGGSYTPGAALQVRLQVSAPVAGATQISVTVWAAGRAEPATPTLTRTDSTASLQAAGGVGVQGYLSGSATKPTAVLVGPITVRPGA